MAEINSSAQRSSGNVRRKSSPIRIDMTPMVDLGFLLITFFMLTTVLNNPVVLPIEKYSDEENDTGHRKRIQEKNLMTLVLGEKNRVYWFIGTTDPKVEVTDFSVNGLRKILLSKKAEIKDLYVFIKASEQSRYQNLVDILDEMTIADIQHYSLLDVTPKENHLIASLKQ
jgi:biopolymer transport protein ExbD